MRTTGLLVLTLLTLSWPALGVAGDSAFAVKTPITVRPELRVGAEWKYAVSFDLLLSDDRDESSEIGRIVQAAHVTLRALRDEPDGSHVIEGRFDRLTSVWRRGDVQYEFSWVRPEKPEKEEAPAPLPAVQKLGPVVKQPAPDDGAIFEAAFTALVKRPFQIILSPDGRVASVQGFGVALKLLAKAAALDPSVMGMFFPTRFGEALEPIWRADGAGAVRKVGDTWTQRRSVEFGQAGRFEFTTDWTAKNIKRDVLDCAGVTVVKAIKPDHMSPAQPSVEIVHSDGGATFSWSLSDQTLIEREQRLSLGVRWKLGDLETALNQLSTSRLRRLP